MVHFLVRGFRRPRAAVESALGTLERQVFEGLFALGREATVREVQESLAGTLAYTTLMTTLDRLFKKGLLDRRRKGRAFVYEPRVTPDQLRCDVAADVIDSLLGGDRESARPVLSTFIDAVQERDRGLLDELEALIAEKRRGSRKP
jgi:predicted transcriptional regulator